MRKGQIALLLVRVVVYVGLFAALCFLFMQQATGEYRSDLPAHITPPADDTYSALRFLYTALIGAFGLPGIAVFLALAELGTIAATELLIRKLAPDVKPAAAFILALACNFAIAIYIPFIHSYYTVGSPGGNCWHNSTYSVMRLLALLTIFYYLKFDGRLQARSKAASWAAFTVLLTLTTMVKPSFVIAFGPSVFLLCLVDLKREGRSSVRGSLLKGLALVIALAVVVYQLKILFPSDGSGEGGIAFGLAKVWRARHANIFVSFLQSFAFPLLIAVRLKGKLWEDRLYLLALVMAVISLAEYVFLYETGARTYHGNFSWGLSFCLFYLFIIACIAFINERGRLFGMCRKAEQVGGSATLEPARGSDEVGAVADSPRGVLDYATIVAFALHTASGVWYFIRMMMGGSYY